MLPPRLSHWRSRHLCFRHQYLNSGLKLEKLASLTGLDYGSMKFREILTFKAFLFIVLIIKTFKKGDNFSLYIIGGIKHGRKQIFD